MTDEIIDKLLESLWLQDRLSHNTLQGYRRDLEKIAARLEAGGHTWLDAEAADLADAVYAADENTARRRAPCPPVNAYTPGWKRPSGGRTTRPVSSKPRNRRKSCPP